MEKASPGPQRLLVQVTKKEQVANDACLLTELYSARGRYKWYAYSDILSMFFDDLPNESPRTFFSF